MAPKINGEGLVTYSKDPSDKGLNVSVEETTRSRFVVQTLLASAACPWLAAEGETPPGSAFPGSFYKRNCKRWKEV